MASENNRAVASAASHGLTWTGLLFSVLLILKLLGYISISWWLVFAPLYVPWLLVIAAILIGLLIWLLAIVVSDWLNKRKRAAVRKHKAEMRNRSRSIKE